MHHIYTVRGCISSGYYLCRYSFSIICSIIGDIQPTLKKTQQFAPDCQDDQDLSILLPLRHDTRTLLTASFANCLLLVGMIFCQTADGDDFSGLAETIPGLPGIYRKITLPPGM